MKRFIIKLLLFAAPSIILYSIAFSFSLSEIRNKFMTSKIVSEIYEPHRLERLQKVENKIIIIGGSSVLFGLDPYLLESITHKKVINLAHFRTDGVENMLLLAKKVYQKNDIILICLEYGVKSLSSSGYMLNYVLTGNPKHILNPKSIYYSFKNAVQKEDTSFFGKQDFYLYNSYDSSFYLKGLDSKIINHHMITANEQIDFVYDQEDINFLKQFQSQGYQIVAFHPPLCRELISPAKLAAEKDKTIGLPIKYITSQADYMFGQDSIYDYPYHLNYLARSVRTVRLANDLLQYSNTNK